MEIMLSEIDRTKSLEVLRSYGKDITIATLGSHSALNILRGAKDEGFRTVCVCRERESWWRKTPL